MASRRNFPLRQAPSEVKARLSGNPEKPTIARFCLDCLFKVLNLMIVTLLQPRIQLLGFPSKMVEITTYDGERVFQSYVKV